MLRVNTPDIPKPSPEATMAAAPTRRDRDRAVCWSAVNSTQSKHSNTSASDSLCVRPPSLF